jgi:hypothetical protein
MKICFICFARCNPFIDSNMTIVLLATYHIKQYDCTQIVQVPHSYRYIYLRLFVHTCKHTATLSFNSSTKFSSQDD